MYLRWLKEVACSNSAQEAVRMTRLKWETVGVGRHATPWFDVVGVDRVEKLVCLQADPTAAGYFFHNRFIC